MNGNNLFFKIHYCNGRKLYDSEKTKGKITKMIRHHELLYITGGKGSIIINKKRFPLTTGMLFYICPDVKYSIILDPNEPTYFMSVHFSYARVNYSNDKWDIKKEEANLTLQPLQVLKDYYLIEDTFKKLVDSWNLKLPGYEFVAKTLLEQLIIAIYQNIKNQNQNYSISLKIEKIIEYMHQNIDKKVTLTEISEMVHLSAFYVSRAFKSSTGYTVIEYFNKIKIDKAKELMVEGDKKIKEVANEMGFTDEFYFSRIFKKAEGISPSEFYSKYVHGI
jgi:AraC family transcriptional regulator, transcriptional activator for feuABC-ybbA operon